MAGLLRRLFEQAFPSARPGESLDPADGSPPGSPDAVIRAAAGMLGPVATAYQRRLRQCGPTPKGAFWSHQDNVRKRFDILCRIFDPADVSRGGAVVRDFGCGYGALFDHLQYHPVLKDGQYVGYDISESMLEACNHRISDPRASFRRSARPRIGADYTLVSGTFNMKLGADDDSWLAYVHASLEVLWETTGTAMAFNMLDARHFDPSMEGLYYADAGAMIRYCLDNLSDDVRIIDDYDLPDFTIQVRRV